MLLDKKFIRILLCIIISMSLSNAALAMDSSDITPSGSSDEYVVGGGNGKGVRKVNFENHEASHFSCPDNDDYGGSVFYDRNEGLYICRHGSKYKIADQGNDVGGVSGYCVACYCDGNGPNTSCASFGSWTGYTEPGGDKDDCWCKIRLY